MADSKLEYLEPGKIVKNPANPRMIFREEDMIQLLESIKKVGVEVPITVYEDKSKYFLLDGERRWRCVLKLNMKKIPAIIQPKPNKLENLLMMFNIHNVRVQWDIMPTALKLKEVKELLKKAGKEYSDKTLAAFTGLRPVQVARYMELLELPPKYQQILINEARKPKAEQKITPDLFLEIIKSKNAIERHVPEVFERVNKKHYADVMVDKYRKGTINNIVKFRDISKIARSEEKGVAKSLIVSSVTRLIKDPNYKIETAFTETSEINYKIRDVKTKLKSLLTSLKEIEGTNLSNDILELLIELGDLIQKLVQKKK